MVIRAKSSGQMDNLLSHNSFPVFVSVGCETRGRWRLAAEDPVSFRIKEKLNYIWCLIHF